MANRAYFGLIQLPSATCPLTPAAARDRQGGPSRRWVLLFPCVALAVLLLPSSAAAADHPLEATLALKQNAAKKKATIVWITKKNPPLMMPAVPPTSVGGTLTVTGVDGRVSARLPARHWKVNRAGTQYKFTNKFAPGGTSPVNVAVLKVAKRGKLLKVVARDSLIQLDDLRQGTVAIALTIGSDTYCSVCTTPDKDEPGKFMAKRCTAPVDCSMAAAPAYICGDAVCDPTESCASCPQDCGVCPAQCGDLVCASTEDCAACPSDCGACPDRCGDLTCGPTESCATCPDDCGTCVDPCGNGVCEETEGCSSCPQDCGVCATECGNGLCGEGEDCVGCAPDCGDCPALCGDDLCIGDETCASCPDDCGECPETLSGQMLPESPVPAMIATTTAATTETRKNPCAPYATVFENAAREFAYKVPVNLLRAVARAESDCDRSARSDDGSGCGIMQLTGETKTAIAKELKVTEEQLCENSLAGATLNIRAGAKILTEWKRCFADTEHGCGPGYSFTTEEARKLETTLESWWWPLVGYNNDGADHKLATSDYPFWAWSKMCVRIDQGDKDFCQPQPEFRIDFQPSYPPLVPGTVAYCSNGAMTPAAWDGSFIVDLTKDNLFDVYPLLSNFTDAGIPNCGASDPRIRWVRRDFDFLSEITLHNDDGSLYCSGPLCGTRDLVPKGGTATPSTVPAGGAVKVDYNLDNLGSGVVTEDYVERFYVSVDATLDGGDQFIGTSPPRQADLGAGASLTLSHTVTVPNGTPTGNRYLLIVADAFNAIAETNEGNNVFPIVLTISLPFGKDLVIEGLGTSVGSVPPGGSLVVSYRVVNRGGGTVTEDYREKVWLSKDTALDGTDVLLATTAIHTQDLALGAALPVVQPITIPAAATGNRYLIVVADADGAVAEASETNNSRTVSFTVGGPANLPAPTLLSPSDGAIGVALPPTFSWSAVPNAGSYRLMIATTRSALPTAASASECPECTLNETPTGSSFRPSANLAAGTQYWWQVKARNANQFGTWSDPTAFTTAALTNRYLDNGDGTVTDTQTGLQWEKKTTVVGSGVNYSDPHDVDNFYSWCLNANLDFSCDNPGNPPDGSGFTQFLAALNTPPCFAGHCDWRLPESGGIPESPSGEPAELESILLAPYPCGTMPCIDPAFGPAVAGAYWSATTYAPDPTFAWFVYFLDGFVHNGGKDSAAYVRAVRGGL